MVEIWQHIFSKIPDGCRLSLHIKIKLFKSYCSSIYGSELWSLEDDVLQDFFVRGEQLSSVY